MSAKHNRILASGLSAIFLVLALCPAFVSSIGMGPGTNEYPFISGEEYIITLRIGNEEKKNVTVFLSVDGDIANYIEIPEEAITFSSTDDYKKINCILRLPEDIGEPGPHEARILAKVKEDYEQKEGTQINFDVILYSVIRVNVPYPGSYAKIRLLAPNFHVGKESSFGIEINNLGTKPIFADSLINILSPMEATIDTLSGGQTPVESKEKEMVSIPWTPETAGRFRAVADVNYDENHESDEKTFSVGSAKLVIRSISSNNFRLGQISKFDLIINSRWNEEIKDVHADFIIQDYDGNHYSKYSSQSVKSAPFGSNTIPAYLETDRLKSGKYQMLVILHYLGNVEETKYDIEVSDNSVIIVPTGQIISSQAEEKSEIDEIYEILSIIIVLIVISNILIFWKIRSGRKDSYLRKT